MLLFRLIYVLLFQVSHVLFRVSHVPFESESILGGESSGAMPLQGTFGDEAQRHYVALFVAAKALHLAVAAAALLRPDV